MNLYRYEAKNLKGQKINGKLEGENEKAVRSLLKEKGYYVIKISNLSTNLNKEITLFETIKDSDYSNLCKEIYFALSSGIQLLEALEIVKSGIVNKKLQKMLNNIYIDVEKGSMFSEALKKYPEVPNLLWSMVEVGEATGSLENVMKELSEYYAKKYAQSKKTKNALLYPKFLFGFAIVVLAFLVTYIVPIFVENLNIAHGKMPLPTAIVMGISSFFSKYFLEIIIVALILIGIKKIILNNSKRYIYQRDKLLIQSKIFGTITKLLVTARFATTFSTLFSGGIDIMKCFEITANVIGNMYVKEKLEDSKVLISKGTTIGEALEIYNVLPPMIIRTIKIGEKSGTLDKILKKSSKYYEDEASFKLEAMTKLIEPIMIIILAFLVGFIVVSIIMPVFSMYNAVSRY